MSETIFLKEVRRRVRWILLFMMMLSLLPVTSIDAAEPHKMPFSVGVVHWHGAAPNSTFAHIAISPYDNHDVTWYDFPDGEYASFQAASSAMAEESSVFP